MLTGFLVSIWEPPLLPDAFLSLGVERFVEEEGRLSYILWEEASTVPILA